MQAVKKARPVPSMDGVQDLSSKKMESIRRAMFEALEVEGQEGLTKFRSHYKMLLAYGVLAGAKMKDEIQTGAELARLEGWRVSPTAVKNNDIGEDELVAKLRSRSDSGSNPTA